MLGRALLRRCPHCGGKGWFRGWFTKVDDHIRYIMIRIDPDKVTPTKDEAASKADLAGR